MTYPVLTGVLMMGYAVAGLLFFKFWRKTRDQLFFYFGIAFWILAVNRVANVLIVDEGQEPTTFLYVVRLFAFLLILWAIVAKNRSRA
ncbi:MAG: DUF5985 family protein [Burkholderiales bacterium]